MKDDEQLYEKLGLLSRMAEQCVLDAIRDAIALGEISKAPYRARMAAKAALAGIATLRGNDGPVVYARPGQSQRELATELEEVASQLRLEADEWDAELERMKAEASEARRTASSAHPGSEEVESLDDPEGHSPDRMPREKPGQGGTSE